ncbi:MAG: hypothetical protein VX498_09475 [Myxococcota bacterium]|nr:hypothetical protein [Myxococcota bacterium]
MAVILGGLALFAVYLAVVLAGSKEDFRAPRLRPDAEPPRPDPGRPKRPVIEASDAGETGLPRLRAPAGSVPHGSSSLARPTRDGSDPETEAAGLLRVLESGPDIQRQAAAKALSLPFSGTGNRRVGAALAELVEDEEAGITTRAEAWIALKTVMDQELSWDEEVRIRHAFPEGVDWDWLTETFGGGAGVEAPPQA